MAKPFDDGIIDSEPGDVSLGITLFVTDAACIPVTVFGVDTFLYAWIDDEHARALVDRARDGDDDAARELIRTTVSRWWRRLCAAIVRAVRPKRIYRK